MKNLIIILAAAVLSVVLCGSVLAEKPAEVFITENGGFALPIPAEYRDALTVITPENDPDGILFEVYETASIEAAKNMEDGDGAGWIFSIRKVSREELNSLRYGIMLGEEVFAKAEDGRFCLLCMPTDYRFTRLNYEGTEKEEALFQEMQGWAVSEAPQMLIAQNGLTPWTCTNTDVDQLAARILYEGNRNFNLIFLEEHAHQPDKVDPAPYLEQLAEGASIAEADESETPDGEYIVLNDLETDTRFDFFRAGGNYVRAVWNDGQNQALYKVTFTDETLKVNEIMQAWYEALVQSNQ